MVEYFGAVTIKIYTKQDFPTEADIPYRMTEWSDASLVFYDKGNGELKVLKDNTSKFSVANRGIGETK